jgi:hypothetical protein
MTMKRLAFLMAFLAALFLGLAAKAAPGTSSSQKGHQKRETLHRHGRSPRGLQPPLVDVCLWEIQRPRQFSVKKLSWPLKIPPRQMSIWAGPPKNLGRASDIIVSSLKF